MSALGRAHRPIEPSAVLLDKRHRARSVLRAATNPLLSPNGLHIVPTERVGPHILVKDPLRAVILLADEHGDGRCRHDGYRGPAQEMQPHPIGVMTHDLLAPANNHHEDQQRRGQNAVDDRGPVEHLHGVEAPEVESEADQDAAGQQQVEVDRAPHRRSKLDRH